MPQRLLDTERNTVVAQTNWERASIGMPFSGVHARALLFALFSFLSTVFSQFTVSPKVNGEFVNRVA